MRAEALRCGVSESETRGPRRSFCSLSRDSPMLLLRFSDRSIEWGDAEGVAPLLEVTTFLLRYSLFF